MSKAVTLGLIAATLTALAPIGAQAGSLEGAAIGAGAGAVVAGPPGAVVGGVAGAIIGKRHHRHRSCWVDRAGYRHCAWR